MSKAGEVKVSRPANKEEKEKIEAFMLKAFKGMLTDMKDAKKMVEYCGKIEAMFQNEGRGEKTNVMLACGYYIYLVMVVQWSDSLDELYAVMNSLDRAIAPGIVEAFWFMKMEKEGKEAGKIEKIAGRVGNGKSGVH